MKTLILITLPLWLISLEVHGQTYSIDWYAVTGGGGTSTSSTYSVSSAIGQHSSGGLLTGGGYSIAGGFWAPYAAATAPTPGSPVLSILLSDTNTVVVAWPAPSTGWTLQLNSNLAFGAWNTLTNPVSIVNGQNQIILSPAIGNQFYRLQQP